jgi:hypothetical protein
LKKAPVTVAQVGGVAAAEDFKRHELCDRRVEARFVDVHLDLVGVNHRAGQHCGEGLADANRTAAGAPPALQRIRFDGLCGRRYSEQSSTQHPRTQHPAPAPSTQHPAPITLRHTFLNRLSAMNSLIAMVVCNSSTPIRSTSIP